jgi:deoxyribonuclease IV
VRFGAQVGQSGGFLAALGRGEEMGAEVLQLFAQSTRRWHLPATDAGAYRDYCRAVAASTVVTATVCHAPYLINVISPDGPTADRSRASLRANLRAATLLGADGLVLHPGSHRGVHAESATDRIAAEVVAALDAVQHELGTVCDLLLENTAGGGGTVGRSFAELEGVIEASSGDPRLGVCLDTQHLWAAGVSYGTAEAADAVVDQLASVIGLDRLRCLHLNDSKVPFGAMSDRHANLGEGTIGTEALGALLSSPALQEISALPVILEVPGVAGAGPGPVDLERARRIHTDGLAARQSTRRSSGRASRN